MSKLLKLQLACMAIVVMMCAATASAFNPSAYATNSRLATGKWVKIFIPESGMYELTYEELLAMGFDIPSKVRIYGAGGNRINEVLNTTSWDDVSRVPMLRMADKICFYGNGPTAFSISNYSTTPHFTRVFNPYSTEGTYFLTQENGSDLTPSNKTLTLTDYVDVSSSLSMYYHELDETTISSTGKDMFGEDFSNGNLLVDYYLPEISDSSMVVHTSVAVNASEVCYANAAIHSGGSIDTTSYTLSSSRIYNPSNEFIYYNFAAPYGMLKLTEPAERGQYEPILVFAGGSPLINIARLDYFILTYTRNNILKPDEDGNQKQEVFHAKDCLKEFVRYVDRHRTHLVDDVIYLKTEKQGIPIEVAVMYNTDYSENIHSYVNNINTIEGGTHLAGFRAALTRTLKKYADNDPQISKQIEKAKIEIAPEDFREGLTAVISIKVAEPQFEGQTKTKLGNSEVAGAVQQAVGEALANYLEEHPKEAKMICDKVVLAATARIAARKARESVQRKSPMTGGGLPGKLADCSKKDPKECEIFLVEGDSAGGSAKQGRHREFQAILPLRGKILNVEKVQWHRVFESESVMNIIQSIGVRFGVEGEGDREANIDKLRYDKIIIMTDADVDGSHIDTLIMTLFYRFMPQVIQGGHLYIATPPLYKCTYKKTSEYCYTDQQRQAFIDKYVNGDENSSGFHTQRYKGLGEMNPEQLWETTMNPENRLLKQVTIENAAEADEIFSMLMGDDVEPRREFIEKNATYANIDA